MSEPSAPPPADGWHAAVPEIVIAAVVVVVAGVAGYAAAGLPGTVVVVACAAVAALVVLRGLAPPRAIGRASAADPEELAVTFTGYWRKAAGLAEGSRSLAAYDANLRGNLQHLLAARLAERHGISLRDDPAAARALLCPRPRDQGLWYWVDPARPAVTMANQGGIPPRTLARIIERLEQL
jgi:hypothetical protein